MHTIWKGMLLGAATAVAVAHAPAALAATCGDSDNSGAVAINDVVLHLRVVSGIDSAASLCGNLGYADCANLNGDGAGTTDISDTVLLLRKASNVANCPSDECLARTVLSGCPGTATLPSNITGNLVVPAGCDARIQGVTNVAAGAVLTVEPGATVKGNIANPPSVLVVRPGGRINAVGTAGSPITWTSAATPGTRNKEDWGGVVLLGNAPVNEPSISIEGLIDGFFGGTEVDDFSGCMSYNRIQFSGRDLTPDNELNLFQMAGVGNRTQLDHIQAHVGADDAIEWFGGTVNMSYVVASAAGDDSFDHQLGWTGGLQFGLIAQRAVDVEPGGSNGWEMDNSEFGAENLPRSNGRYCNVTAIGVRYNLVDNVGVTNQFGVFSRRGNSMTIANSIVKDFRNGGYQLRDATTAARACVNPATLNTAAPVGVVQNSLFTDNGSGGTTHAVDHSSCPSGGACACSSTEHFALLQAQRAVLATADAAVEAIGGNTFPPTNLVPAPGSLPATHPAANCTQINGSFVNAPYIGAFEPGGADWTAGWTDYPNN